MPNPKHVGQIEIASPEVRKLFQVLTGEEWPNIDETELWNHAQVWQFVANLLEHDLTPEMLEAVRFIRGSFTGLAALNFAEQMEQYVSSPPQYMPELIAQFRELAKFADKMGQQVQMTKLTTILELVLLLAEIAYAIATAFITGGASLVQLAGEYAATRFLVNTLWKRLIFGLIEAQIFGIALQELVVVGAQALQVMMGTRKIDDPDWEAIKNGAKVGAIGGAFAGPLGALGHLITTKLTVMINKMFPEGVVDAGAKGGGKKLTKLPPGGAGGATGSTIKTVGDGAAKGGGRKAPGAGSAVGSEGGSGAGSPAARSIPRPTWSQVSQVVMGALKDLNAKGPVQTAKKIETGLDAITKGEFTKNLPRNLALVGATAVGGWTHNTLHEGLTEAAATGQWNGYAFAAGFSSGTAHLIGEVAHWNLATPKPAEGEFTEKRGLLDESSETSSTYSRDDSDNSSVHSFDSTETSATEYSPLSGNGNANAQSSAPRTVSFESPDTLADFGPPAFSQEPVTFGASIQKPNAQTPEVLASAPFAGRDFTPSLINLSTPVNQIAEVPRVLDGVTPLGTTYEGLAAVLRQQGDGAQAWVVPETGSGAVLVANQGGQLVSRDFSTATPAPATAWTPAQTQIPATQAQVSVTRPDGQVIPATSLEPALQKLNPALDPLSESSGITPATTPVAGQTGALRALGTQPAIGSQIETARPLASTVPVTAQQWASTELAKLSPVPASGVTPAHAPGTYGHLYDGVKDLAAVEYVRHGAEHAQNLLNDVVTKLALPAAPIPPLSPAAPVTATEPTFPVDTRLPDVPTRPETVQTFNQNVFAAAENATPQQITGELLSRSDPGTMPETLLQGLDPQQRQQALTRWAMSGMEQVPYSYQVTSVPMPHPTNPFETVQVHVVTTHVALNPAGPPGTQPTAAQLTQHGENLRKAADAVWNGELQPHDHGNGRHLIRMDVQYHLHDPNAPSPSHRVVDVYRDKGVSGLENSNELQHHLDDPLSVNAHETSHIYGLPDLRQVLNDPIGSKLIVANPRSGNPFVKNLRPTGWEPVGTLMNPSLDPKSVPTVQERYVQILLDTFDQGNRAPGERPENIQNPHEAPSWLPFLGNDTAGGRTRPPDLESGTAMLSAAAQATRNEAIRDLGYDRATPTVAFTDERMRAVQELQRLAGAPAAPAVAATPAAAVTAAGAAAAHLITQVGASSGPALIQLGEIAGEIYGAPLTVAQLQNLRTIQDIVTNRGPRGRAEPLTAAALENLIRGRFLPKADRNPVGPADVQTLLDLAPKVVAQQITSTSGLRKLWKHESAIARVKAEGMVNRSAALTVNLRPALSLFPPARQATLMTDVLNNIRTLEHTAQRSWRPADAQIESVQRQADQADRSMRGVYDAAAAELARRIGMRRNALAGQLPAISQTQEQRDVRAGLNRLDQFTTWLRGRPRDNVAVQQGLEALEFFDVLEQHLNPSMVPPKPKRTDPNAAPEPTGLRLPPRILRTDVRAGEALGSRPISFGDLGQVHTIGGRSTQDHEAIAQQAWNAAPVAFRDQVRDAVRAHLDGRPLEIGARELMYHNTIDVAITVGGLPRTLKLRIVPDRLTGSTPVPREKVQQMKGGTRRSPALDLANTFQTYSGFDYSDSRFGGYSVEGVFDLTGGALATAFADLKLGARGGVSAQRVPSHGDGEVASSILQRWHDQDAYFRLDPAPPASPTNGTHWEFTWLDEHNNPDSHSAPVEVVLAFPTDELGAPGAEVPAGTPRQGTLFQLPPNPSRNMQEEFHGALKRVGVIVEDLQMSGTDPERHVNDILALFPDRSDEFTAWVREQFSPHKRYVNGPNLLDHGRLTETKPVRGTAKSPSADWAGFKSTTRMVSAQRIDFTVEAWHQLDIRKLFWLSNGQQMYNGVNGAVNGGFDSKKMFDVKGGSTKDGGVSVTLRGIGEANAGQTAMDGVSTSVGSGDWRYFAYTTGHAVYEVRFNQATEIRSSINGARRTLNRAETGYIAVSKDEFERFESDLQRALNGESLMLEEAPDPTDATRTILKLALPVDGRETTNRLPPVALEFGESRGTGVTDLMPQWEKVVPKTLEEFGKALTKVDATINSHIKAEDMHNFERDLVGRFSTPVALSHTNQLLTEMTFDRTFEAAGGWIHAHVTVTAKDPRNHRIGEANEDARFDDYSDPYVDFGHANRTARTRAEMGHLDPHFLTDPTAAVKDARLQGRVDHTRRRYEQSGVRHGNWSSEGYVKEKGKSLPIWQDPTFGTKVEVWFENFGGPGGQVSAAVQRPLAPWWAEAGKPSRFVPGKRASSGTTWPGLVRTREIADFAPRGGGFPVSRDLLPDKPIGRVTWLKYPATTNRTPLPLTPAEAGRVVPGGRAGLDQDGVRDHEPPMQMLGNKSLSEITAGLMKDANLDQDQIDYVIQRAVNEDQLKGAAHAAGGPVVHMFGTTAPGTEVGRSADVLMIGVPAHFMEQGGRTKLLESNIWDGEPAYDSRTREGGQTMYHAQLANLDQGKVFVNADSHVSGHNYNIDKQDVLELVDGIWVYQAPEFFKQMVGDMIWLIRVSAHNHTLFGAGRYGHHQALAVVSSGVQTLRPLSSDAQLTEHRPLLKWDQAVDDTSVTPPALAVAAPGTSPVTVDSTHLDATVTTPPAPGVQRVTGKNAPATLHKFQVTGQTAIDRIRWPSNWLDWPDGQNPVQVLVHRIVEAIDPGLKTEKWSIEADLKRTTYRTLGAALGKKTLLGHKPVAQNRLAFHVTYGEGPGRWNTTIELHWEDGTTFTKHDEKKRIFNTLALNTRSTRTRVVPIHAGGVSESIGYEPKSSGKYSYRSAEATLSHDWYQAKTRGTGEVMRIREVFGTKGDIASYYNAPRIVATVYQSYELSKGGRVLGGIPQALSRAVSNPNDPVTLPGVKMYETFAQRQDVPVQFVTPYLWTRSDQIVPVLAASLRDTPTRTLQNLGHTPFDLTYDDVWSGHVKGGVIHEASLNNFTDAMMRHFTGLETFHGATGIVAKAQRAVRAMFPSSVNELMLRTGSAAETMSSVATTRSQFLVNLHNHLVTEPPATQQAHGRPIALTGRPGQEYGGLVTPNGTISDATGTATVTVKYFDMQMAGNKGHTLTEERNGMREGITGGYAELGNSRGIGGDVFLTQPSTEHRRTNHDIAGGFGRGYDTGTATVEKDIYPHSVRGIAPRGWLVGGAMITVTLDAKQYGGWTLPWSGSSLSFTALLPHSAELHPDFEFNLPKRIFDRHQAILTVHNGAYNPFLSLTPHDPSQPGTPGVQAQNLISREKEIFDSANGLPRFTEKEDTDGALPPGPWDAAPESGVGPADSPSAAKGTWGPVAGFFRPPAAGTTGRGEVMITTASDPANTGLFATPQHEQLNVTEFLHRNEHVEGDWYGAMSRVTNAYGQGIAQQGNRHFLFSSADVVHDSDGQIWAFDRDTGETVPWKIAFPDGRVQVLTGLSSNLSTLITSQLPANLRRPQDDNGPGVFYPRNPVVWGAVTGGTVDTSTDWRSTDDSSTDFGPDLTGLFSGATVSFAPTAATSTSVPTSPALPPLVPGQHSLTQPSLSRPGTPSKGGRSVSDLVAEFQALAAANKALQNNTLGTATPPGDGSPMWGGSPIIGSGFFTSPATSGTATPVGPVGPPPARPASDAGGTTAPTGPFGVNLKPSSAPGSPTVAPQGKTPQSKTPQGFAETLKLWKDLAAAEKNAPSGLVAPTATTTTKTPTTATLANESVPAGLDYLSTLFAETTPPPMPLTQPTTAPVGDLPTLTPGAFGDLAGPQGLPDSHVPIQRNTGLQVLGLQQGGEGDCYYYSSLYMIDENFLTQYVFGGQTLNDGGARVQALRNYLADAVQADLALARQGLPSRYGSMFTLRPGQTYAQRHAEVVNDLRNRYSYQNEAGDRTPAIMAREFGLGMIVLDRNDANYDARVTDPPENGQTLYTVRAGEHYLGGLVMGGGRPVRWDQVTPPGRATQQAAQQYAQNQQDIFDESLASTIDALDTAETGLTDPAAQAAFTVRRGELEQQIDDLETLVGQQPIVDRWEFRNDTRFRLLVLLQQLAGDPTGPLRNAQGAATGAGGGS